ncbi:hypothetical protein COLO4_20098 [Corchorus olitorius]|uniref:Uncharacterized protein n=1 Tax=Corchorus olitorius TaxID=93759 RepID=A0A1R3J1M9_9ROSI|nr:hypothetical protein COLO4_20098 [Corchorus olitorius]
MAHTALSESRFSATILGGRMLLAKLASRLQTRQPGHTGLVANKAQVVGP